jgi:hypothetical protein
MDDDGAVLPGAWAVASVGMDARAAHRNAKVRSLMGAEPPDEIVPARGATAPFVVGRA